MNSDTTLFQSKELCEEKHKTLEDSLHKLQSKQDEICKKLNEVYKEVYRIELIENELRHVKDDIKNIKDNELKHIYSKLEKIGNFCTSIEIMFKEIKGNNTNKTYMRGLSGRDRALVYSSFITAMSLIVVEVIRAIL